MTGLEDLPAELIREIYDLVRVAHPRQYLGAVSRLFLPVSRQLFFKSVKVRTYKHLGTLCDVLSGEDGPARVVKELEMDFEGEADTKSPKSLALKRLFRDVSGVSSLTIKHSTRIAKLVLAPTRPYPLALLQSLTLRDSFSGWSNPFDPSHFTEIGMYGRLTSLTIEVVERTAESIGRYQPRDLELPKWESWWISLEGPLDNPAVEDLISFFPHIDGLRLNNTETSSSNFSLVPLFEEVRDPDCLTVLSFGNTTYPVSDILTVLAIFPDLQNIELTPSPFCKILFSALCALPELRRIYLLSGNTVPTDTLKLLVSEETKPPRLEYLAVNTVRFCGNGCCAFAWNGTDFTVDGMVEALELADASGVEVTGFAALLAREEIALRKLEQVKEGE
ncbi:hypothetical protein JCM6882_007419 [Rhodosporidiobolus microsporus]